MSSFNQLIGIGAAVVGIGGAYLYALRRNRTSPTNDSNVNSSGTWPGTGASTRSNPSTSSRHATHENIDKNENTKDDDAKNQDNSNKNNDAKNQDNSNKDNDAKKQDNSTKDNNAKNQGNSTKDNDAKNQDNSTKDNDAKNQGNSTKDNDAKNQDNSTKDNDAKKDDTPKEDAKNGNLVVSTADNMLKSVKEKAKIVKEKVGKL